MAEALPSNLESQKVLNNNLSAFVANLPPYVFNSHLKRHFQRHVTVLSANVIRNPQTGTSKCYGFVSVSSEQDLTNLMSLPQKHLTYGNYIMVVKTAHHNNATKPTGKSRNYSTNECPLPSDRTFDLTPLDPRKPSGHILVDDVMLQILAYLSIEEAFKLELVCRRWQCLLYNLYGNTKAVFLGEINCPWGAGPFIINKNGIESSIRYRRLDELQRRRFKKMMIVTGETLTHLDLNSFIRVQRTMVLIGQLAPNLKNLHIGGGIGCGIVDFTPIAKNCHQLQEVHLTGAFHTECPLKGLSHCTNLTALRLDEQNFCNEDLNAIPATITELKFRNVCIDDFDYLENTVEILARFPNLQKLSIYRNKENFYFDAHLYEQSVPMLFDQDCVDRLAQSCPKIEHLTIEATREHPHMLDFKPMKKLKRLNLIGKVINMQRFMATALPPTIEEICLQFSINVSEREEDDRGSDGYFVDFSVTPPLSLKKLRLPSMIFTDNSLLTLVNMSSLNELYFQGAGPATRTIKQLVCMLRLSDLGVGHQIISEKLFSELVNLRKAAHKRQLHNVDRVDLTQLTLQSLTMESTPNISNDIISVEHGTIYDFPDIDSDVDSEEGDYFDLEDLDSDDMVMFEFLEEIGINGQYADSDDENQFEDDIVGDMHLWNNF